MPEKARKKPVIVEVMELDFSNNIRIAEIMEWAGDKVEFSDYDPDTNRWGSAHIPTLEGRMEARNGDIIIKGVQGEFYPCKPDIFLETYEYVIN